MKSFIEITAFGEISNDLSQLDKSKKSCYVDIITPDEQSSVRFHFYDKASVFILNNFAKGDHVFIKGTVQVVNVNKDTDKPAQFKSKFVGLIASK